MSANYQAWSEGSVLAREAGRVLTITLNRPERKNPLTFESYAEMRDLFRKLAYVPESIQAGFAFNATDRSRGILVNDFYDVVYSDFFKSVSQNPLAPRNWNTGLTFQRH